VWAQRRPWQKQLTTDPPPAERLTTDLQLTDAGGDELAARLIDRGEPETDSQVDEAWAPEIRERLGRLDRGQGRTIPWVQARRMIQADDEEDVAPRVPSARECRGSGSASVVHDALRQGRDSVPRRT
jgi:hypothetical protein